MIPQLAKIISLEYLIISLLVVAVVLIMRKGADW
jgi:hypothetical protein